MPQKNCSNRIDFSKAWFVDVGDVSLTETTREIKAGELSDTITWIDGWEIKQPVETVPEIKMTIKAEDLTGLDVKAEIQSYKYADLADIRNNTHCGLSIKNFMISYIYYNTDTNIKIKVERLYGQTRDDDVFAEIARLYDKAVEEKKEKEKNMKRNEQPCWDITFLPPVIDMKSFNNKVVVVYFADGTHTKAVCSDNDIFDLDTGIMCCLFKRALDRGNGTKVLNKLIRSVHDIAETKEAVRKAALNLKKARREAQAAAHARNVEAEAKANAKMVDIVAAGVKKALEEAKSGET